uniref:Cadherin domain-containing protein n=1 Tax=Xiphophorus couchianus TaxID=32473 RepID=A0A3B5LRC9_9TELE
MYFFNYLFPVGFTDCTGRTQFLFSTDDSHFVVETDGIITVSTDRPITARFHPGFTVHQTFTVRFSHLQTEYLFLQDPAGPQIPVLDFIKSSPGQKRRKRSFVVPPLNIVENHRGPYPLFFIRSDRDKVMRLYYMITGPGADEPPVGLFTLDRANGHLYVTEEVDREKQDKYMLIAHAMTQGGEYVEEPMEIIINVIDQNDNKPIFNQSIYMGEVPEASQKGKVIQVVAMDADEPNTENSDICYRIMRQRPEQPGPNMFIINPVTGVITVNEAGLDRKKIPQYTLEVLAADMKGEGLTGFATVIIKVTDGNDHAPVFTEPSVNALVVKMLVTDGDEPHTMAWDAKFKIIDGDPGNLFTVETGTNKQEGVITAGLDFERTSNHTLLVTVVNEAPPSVPLVTSTATVLVTVLDVNEPPILESEETHVSKSEDLAVNSLVVKYTASDPDSARKQKVMYKLISDPAGWLDIDKETGVITVRNQMDRESSFVKKDIYTALIGAYDDGGSTGTGTLILTLKDVNDNAPIIEERSIIVCNKKPAPQLLTVTDKDGPGFASPYSVSLRDSAMANWIARVNDATIILTLNRELENGNYAVVMTVSDTSGLSQVSTVTAAVCDCTGEEVNCQKKNVGGSNPPVILGILKGILMLLFMLGLPFFLFVRRRRTAEEPVEFNDLNNKFEEEKMEERENLQVNRDKG